MPKRTFQPKKKKRPRVHGFLRRMRTSGGRATIKRRVAKGRRRIAV